MDRRFGRILPALAGLTVCAALAAGLVAVACQAPPNSPTPASATASRSSATASPALPNCTPAPANSAPAPATSSPTPAPTKSPASSRPVAIGGIDWQAGEKRSEAWGVQAVLSLDDKVLAFGSVVVPKRVGGEEVGAVWSSTDGLTWKLVTGPDAFPKGFSIILDASPDGHGGIFATVLLEAETRDYTCQGLWHSADGLAWTPVELVPPKYPNALVVASNARMTVVEGSLMLADRLAGYVWSSADGSNWSSAELPPADGYQLGYAPNLAAGAGGFEILDTSDGNLPAHAWHSDDGRTWVETPAPGLTGADAPADDHTSLLAVGAGFVAVGHVGSVEAPKPAAWWTPDGKTWTKSVMEDPGERFGCKSMCEPIVVTQVGSSLVAMGYAKKDTTDSLSPAASVVVWTSEDAGRTWKLLGSAPAGVVPAFAATFHSQPIVLDTTEATCSYRGSITWKPFKSPSAP